MTERQLIVETRKLRVDWWLARLPLDSKFVPALEDALAFKRRLDAWAVGPIRLWPQPFTGTRCNPMNSRTLFVLAFAITLAALTLLTILS